jgi:hypothetical protein
VLRLTVVSPADNAHFELPEVPAGTTAGEIVEQFVRQGLLPAPEPGRAHVLSIRGGEILDPDQPLHAAGVPSGATLQIFSTAQGAGLEAVRRERLRGDLAEMARIRAPHLDWRAEGGDPPTAYVVTYHLPSFVTAGFDRRDRHRVRFELGPAYPLEPPHARVLDAPPVFHPNVFPDGRICTGAWSPVEGLAFVVIRVARMLVYDPRLTNPDHPACSEAAEWYRANPGRFPAVREPAFPDPLTGILATPCPTA